jgi:dipeptidyl aminopeptidase/acylaminoacyl peptidase
MKEALYGTWESPISADQLAINGKKFFDIVGDGQYVYNVEMRPNEAGRYVIVQYDSKGNKKDILPAPYSARTRVHEYGGRSFTVKNDMVFFVNFEDQNLYWIPAPDAEPQRITADGVRFAELSKTFDGLVAVAERHKADGSEAENFLAWIDIFDGTIKELDSGYDFYAFPTLSDTFTNPKIAWICWNHPNMPWDDNELWVGDLIDGEIKNKRRIMNESEHQSFYQPQWDINGNLVFITDKSNWWNPYLWNAKTNKIIQILKQDYEFADALWGLGSSVMAQHEALLFFTYASTQGTKLVMVDPEIGLPNHSTLDLPFTTIDDLCIHNGNLYFVGASPIHAPSLVRCSVRHGSLREIKVLAESSSLQLPKDAISISTHIEFATAGRQGISHAYFYPPKNPKFKAPAGTRPPLVVMIHGGPTSASTNALKLEIQFWTSRGFAVVDINYGGSTGYGRAYRKCLQRDNPDEAGYWGDIDVKDTEACVRFLQSQSLVDPSKIVIRGRSAGGYTTLAALAFTNVFCAGTSIYGVSDIAALAHDTHKFESRYMDQLVGALPQFQDVYDRRSPINNLETITEPVLVLQGDEDKIVPTSQAEMMVAALRKRGVRVEYKLYQGEQHGFRKAETIIDAITRELQFYLSVFYPEVTLTAKKSEGARLGLNPA